MFDPSPKAYLEEHQKNSKNTEKGLKAMSTNSSLVKRKKKKKNWLYLMKKSNDKIKGVRLRKDWKIRD